MTKFGLARIGVSSDSGTIDAALAGVIAEASIRLNLPLMTDATAERTGQAVWH